MNKEHEKLLEAAEKIAKFQGKNPDFEFSAKTQIIQARHLNLSERLLRLTVQRLEAEQADIRAYLQNKCRRKDKE